MHKGEKVIPVGNVKKGNEAAKEESWIQVSYFNIAKGLTGKVPNTPLSLAQEAVQQALGMIYDMTDWSFQRTATYANWLCPGQVANVGTATVTQYSPTVTLDATASNALATGLAAAGVFCTTLQFRQLSYSIYNIIAYNVDNPTAAVLTLDRPWLEPAEGPITYMIYQAYFVAPVQDFRKFIEVRDTRNAHEIDFWSMTEAELSLRDPQRTRFTTPAEYVVPMGIDQRPGSSTQGWQMFELWPQQLSQIPISFSFRRRGQIPQTYDEYRTLTTPYPITEEFLTWRAKETLFQDAAARMEAVTPGSGRGMMLLSQQAEKQSMKLYSEILSVDININGEAFTRIRGRGRHLRNTGYSNYLGQLNVGGYPER